MSTSHFLYKSSYQINDAISIYIPTVGEVIDNEDDYYNLVHTITAMPIDFMVQLDDIGIDFTDISSWDLFLLLFDGIKELDKNILKLVFCELDLSNFELCVDEEKQSIVIRDNKNDITIDKRVHAHIASILRKIHRIEQDRRKPANEEAKEYMLRRAREKMKRNRNRKYDSQIESLVIALVNTEQFKYNFEETRELSIYQFNESVRQVIKKIDYDNRMHGVYAGTIDPKELRQDDLNWLIH